MPRICPFCDGDGVLGILRSTCYGCAGSGIERPLHKLSTVVPTAPVRKGSKLTKDDVISIRRYHEQKMLGKEIAKLFDVSPSLISNIINGLVWKEVH